MSSSPRRIAIIDDHHLFREGLVGLFCNYEKEIQVVFHGESIDEHFEKILDSKPQVILADLHLKGGSSLPDILRLKKKLTRSKIIVITVNIEQRSVNRLSSAKVDGVVHKTIRHEQLLDLIERVCCGEKVYFPEDLRNMICPSKVNQAIDDLTKREFQVLSLIGNGRSTKEIASQLEIGKRSVEKHMERLFRKLGAENQIGLYKIALEEGVTTLQS